MKWCTFYLVFALLFGAAALATAQEKKEKKGKLGEFVDDYQKKKKDKDSSSLATSVRTGLPQIWICIP